jgi:DNA polymerase I-like protein with 3'-5' exonuclease and polymerase domains
MLYAQKGPYQKCMERDHISVKRVPALLSSQLKDILNREIEFDPILFSAGSDKTVSDGAWKLVQSEDKNGNIIEGMHDIRCIFRPSLSLKAISKDLGFVKNAKTYKDLEIPFEQMPSELGFAPYGRAFYNVTEDQQKLVREYLVRSNNTKRAEEKLELPFFGTWVYFLKFHVDFWETKEAKEYATDDVIYTRKLYNTWEPELGDDDSMLATCVGACRWKGYNIDRDGLIDLKEQNLKKISESVAKDFFSKPAQCIKYIKEAMTDFDRLIFEKACKGKAKTDKITLEKLAKSDDPSGKRAKEILSVRKAAKENEVIDKILIAGRFHASFRVIGALSSRMSGADGLNAQGINKKHYFRSKFPLAFPGFKLTGGDFSSFEVTIFEAVSNDPKLREDLLSGKKIHGIFGTFVYPDMTYDEIVASAGSSDDKYTRSKSALFAMLYGGEARTLMTRLGVDLEDAQAAYERFLNAYPGAKSERTRIKEMFSPMMHDEESNRFYWAEFDEGIESLYGFKRYFNIEFYVAKKLFDILNSLPKEWQRLEGKIIRSDLKGIQSYAGATMSALFSCIFNIQSTVFRQAANHRIQSTGAQVTKKLERRIWEIQPIGRNPWVVQPMNIHDEIMCPIKEEKIPVVKEIVNALLKEVSDVVPLVGIDWHDEMKNWAEK